MLKNHPPNGFLGLRASIDILVYWALFGVCHGISGFKSSQERERRAAELEARLAQSKLQALRMQINPHFLFNTLNAISTLVYVDPKSADEMIGDLSDLLRRSIDSVEEQENTLKSELEFIQAYVGIEKKRFGARLEVVCLIPDELSQALVPTLILQPLVENAIRHGIEPQRNPGVVTIVASRQEGRLRITVQDNGKGLDATPPIRPRRQGIGLKNTEARLRALYGENQQFTFGSAQPRGCKVELVIPFHTGPLAEPNPPAAA